MKVRIFLCHNALTEGVETSLLLRKLGLAHGLKPRSAGLVERLPCLGKIDPRYLLRAFEGGCDAICLIGCPIGKCRTMDGNLRAQKRVAFVRRILDEIGFQGERLFLFLREPMDQKGLEEVVGEFLAAVKTLPPTRLISPQRAQRAESV